MQPDELLRQMKILVTLVVVKMTVSGVVHYSYIHKEQSRALLS